MYLSVNFKRNIYADLVDKTYVKPTADPTQGLETAFFLFTKGKRWVNIYWIYVSLSYRKQWLLLEYSIDHKKFLETCYRLFLVFDFSRTTDI